MDNFNNSNIKDIVRNSYKEVVNKGNTQGCCENSLTSNSNNISKSIGYSNEDINTVPENSNLGLGCGNPQLIANIKQGEIVLDLGSGAGFDCFIASKKAGENGLVIGVDMTPEMISKGRENAINNNYSNVEFRLGEIENLPIENDFVDVIISNCVINLSPNKQRVYDEIYRVLKTNGRIAISDVVLVKELDAEMKSDEKLYCG